MSLFLFCFVFVLRDTALFLVCVALVGWSIDLFWNIFVLPFIIKLCFRFSVILGRVTVGRGVGLDDWLEVRLVLTAAGDWSAVRWVAAAGDWLKLRWVAAASDWLVVRSLAEEGASLEVGWVAGEGNWLEVCWVAGAEFRSSWPKVSVSSLFWADKMWIDASGADAELLWSPISSFLMMLVEISDSS